MDVPIPYASEPRADTGLSNAQLGMWLFLASETMLFGALFSAYVLLRTGAPSGAFAVGAWPRGWDRLDLRFGALATALLIGGAVAIMRARRGPTRGPLALAASLGALFLIITLMEYARLLAAGNGPWRDTFIAIYFALTGVHGLHVLGGVIALAWLTIDNRWRTRSRLEAVATYWLFVDAIWLVLIVAFYLS